MEDSDIRYPLIGDAALSPQMIAKTKAPTMEKRIAAKDGERNGRDG